MPPELRDALLTILTSKDGQQKFHLFSDAFDACKVRRAEHIEQEAVSKHERKRKLSE